MIGINKNVLSFFFVFCWVAAGLSTESDVSKRRRRPHCYKGQSSSSTQILEIYRAPCTNRELMAKAYQLTKKFEYYIMNCFWDNALAMAGSCANYEAIGKFCTVLGDVDTCCLQSLSLSNWLDEFGDCGTWNITFYNTLPPIKATKMLPDGTIAVQGIVESDELIVSGVVTESNRWEVQFIWSHCGCDLRLRDIRAVRPECVSSIDQAVTFLCGGCQI